MRHRTRIHQCLLLALAIAGCNRGDPFAPRREPIAFEPFIGTWDLIDVPIRVDSSVAGVQDITAEELAITEQRSWWVVRTDRYIVNGDTSHAARRVLDGTWTAEESSLLLSAASGEVQVSLSGDTLTMSDECHSIEECFAPRVVLHWIRRRAVQ